MMLALVLAAAGLAAALTRGGLSRRIPAALVPCALWLLATQPGVPWPGTPRVELDANATLADVEATLAATRTGSAITISGDGIHPEFLPLLSDRVLRWEAPTTDLGVTSLSWPRRVAVGQPVRLSGTLDVPDSVLVRLTTPEGVVDSVRTDSAFVFVVTPRATGRWLMHLAVAGVDATLGLHVIAPPRLRVLVIAGRPDFEVPALMRRLRAQDADVTVRTQVTRERRLTEQQGTTPVSPRVTDEVMDSLDLVVVAAGGAATLNASEQRVLAAAVEEGLGLLHIVESPVVPGPLAPFAVRASGTEWSARLTFEGALWPGVVRVAPLIGPDSLAFLRDSTGRGLAWRARTGGGVIAVTALGQAHRWTLAGHPESEATWWSALLGPVIRAPTGRWSVRDDAVVRIDEPFAAEWSGGPPEGATLREGELGSSVRVHQPDSAGPAILRLWPRDSGWLSLTAERDTLHLWVAPSDAVPGVLAAARRAAMSAASQGASGRSSTGRRPFPRMAAWLLLMTAIAAAWRPR